MKKLCVGVLLASALLFAQTASAGPCGLLCQAYVPCSLSCEDCVADLGSPGLWVSDGYGGYYCWGEVVESTCGEYGQCNGGLLASTSCFAPIVDQGVHPERAAQPSPAPAQAAPQSR